MSWLNERGYLCSGEGGVRDDNTHFTSLGYCAVCLEHRGQGRICVWVSVWEQIHVHSTCKHINVIRDLQWRLKACFLFPPPACSCALLEKHKTSHSVSLQVTAPEMFSSRCLSACEHVKQRARLRQSRLPVSQPEATNIGPFSQDDCSWGIWNNKKRCALLKYEFQ